MSRVEDLIRRHLDEIATPEERAELERLIVGNPEAAALFARLSRRDAAFRRHFGEERAAGDVARRIRSAVRPRRRWPWFAAAAALLFAFLIPLFRALSVEPLARLERPAPGTEVWRGREAIAPAHGLPLRSGDRVRSSAGPATMAFAGEPTTIRLLAHAEAVIGRPERGKRIELRRGMIEARVAPQTPGRPLVVATPHGEAEVVGTAFRLDVSGASTKLEVTEGRVLLRRASDGAAVEVASLQTAVATAGREAMAAVPSATAFRERFLILWNDLHSPSKGYFSPDGIPYHSVEKLIVDAPDYGHLSTSETFSYWLWLEAAYGAATGDWKPFGTAWERTEAVMIPSRSDQPTGSAYNPARPAVAVPERPTPSEYPVSPDPSAAVGEDRLARELGGNYLYGMHWLVDVDNWYGFGRRGDRSARLVLLNTFQRGPEESVWETIPHPSWEDFQAGGPNGFLDLFIRETSYARQWRYTCAPDADARAIQAIYWAATWGGPNVPTNRAARLGDSLRYALRDKHFRHEPHFLIGWSYAWGGSIDERNPWAWRAGSDQAHIGYQNPVTAWALSTHPTLRTATGKAEWAASLDRQLEFYAWLQSEEGALGGGARVGGGDFHGMAWDPHPVFLDPPSNEWFGWQAWSMDRLAQYLLLTGDPRARPVCEKWVAWIKKVVKLDPNGTYAIPAKLEWTGRPGSLRVRVTEETQDVGVTGALARALVYHAAATKDEGARTLARELLDRICTLFWDERGVSNPEPRHDYRRFHEKVYIPEGWPGPHPSGSTFLDLRPKYRQDADWPRVEAALARGEAPVFRYHRFWAQVEVALALAEYARLFR